MTVKCFIARKLCALNSELKCLCDALSPSAMTLHCTSTTRKNQTFVCMSPLSPNAQDVVSNN